MTKNFRSPKLTKEEKLLGVDTCREMESLDVAALGELIVQASSSVKQAKDELEGNEKYQEVKRSLKALNGGFYDLKKRQNAKIAYALKLRETNGK